MKEITTDELTKLGKCLDTLYDGVHYELNNDIHAYLAREEINALTLTITHVFYAWMRQNNINIDLDKLE